PAATDPATCPRPAPSLPGGGAPEDVAVGVAVEIALADERPGHRVRRARRTYADDARAVHEPDQRLPAAGVAPEDVAPRVIVEIMARGERGPEETRRDETSYAAR